MSTKNPSRDTANTLADVIARIEAMPDLPPPRRHDLTSAVRKVAALLGRPPADIPADPAAIRQRLSAFTAAAAGMSPGRWSNVRSLASRALELTGVHIMRRRSADSLSPEWRNLIGRVDNAFERFRLSRLGGYCSAAGIVPDQVDDTVADGFGTAVLASFFERPKQVHREACLAWNRAVDTVQGWPPIRLSVPQNRRDYSLPLTAYPASFGADVEAYLARLSGRDLFAETACQPASPATLKHVRLLLLQLAAALVLSGRDPTSLQSLADLVGVEAAQTALTFHWTRNGGRKTGRLHQFALLLIKLAKHWVKVPPERLAALRQMRKQADPGATGMTDRNRARLRQFDDTANVRRLINLPYTIARSLTGRLPPSYDDAIHMQSAVAIGIALVAPLRVKNLASLQLDRHLLRTRPGPSAKLHLVVPADEVKNDVALEFELPADLRDLLDTYLASFRPILARQPSPFLFPARQGGAKPAAQLAGQVKRAIHRELGLDLNIHAFRHLAAKLYLQAHPGEYETVRLLLGHKSLTTTVRTYCGLEQGDALRRYDQLLDRYRTGPEPRHAA